MKYERITSRNEEPFYAFDACKECEQKDGCDKWCAYSVGAYTRLHELEDKIERGELISTKEQGDNEIAFFVAHNAAVRKQAVKECLRILHDISSPGIVEPFWVGWSEAINAAIREISEKYAVSVEEVCGE